MKFKNFSHKITKTKEEKIAEKEERKRRKLEQSICIIDVTGDGDCDTSDDNQSPAAASVPNPSPALSTRANNTEPLPGNANQPLSATSVPNPSPASSARAKNAEPFPKYAPYNCRHTTTVHSSIHSNSFAGLGTVEECTSSMLCPMTDQSGTPTILSALYSPSQLTTKDSNQHL